MSCATSTYPVQQQVKLATAARRLTRYYFSARILYTNEVDFEVRICAKVVSKCNAHGRNCFILHKRNVATMWVQMGKQDRAV